MTDKPPSAFKPIVFTNDPGVAFLRRHPATGEVVTGPPTAGVMEAAVHFIDHAGVPSEDDWVMPNANIPEDRDADLSFENTGHAPPLGFWVTHPDVLAWTTSAIESSADAWWVKVWLKPR
ncbi:hypothetical protein [Caulobacter sp.]|uniref:hypothetical protein n=1 Tax=Caulobacter sp. TaxID=78 RepID=UPI001B25B17C|nr:hypothetical protein [Caulobacter sp.]MBO9543490.1 hypothetical protein [Caulobacter sp.]